MIFMIEEYFKVFVEGFVKEESICEVKSIRWFKSLKETTCLLKICSANKRECLTNQKTNMPIKMCFRGDYQWKADNQTHRLVGRICKLCWLLMPFSSHRDTSRPNRYDPFFSSFDRILKLSICHFQRWLRYGCPRTGRTAWFHLWNSHIWQSISM